MFGSVNIHGFELTFPQNPVFHHMFHQSSHEVAGSNRDQLGPKQGGAPPIVFAGLYRPLTSSIYQIYLPGGYTMNQLGYLQGEALVYNSKIDL